MCWEYNFLKFWIKTYARQDWSFEGYSHVSEARKMAGYFRLSLIKPQNVTLKWNEHREMPPPMDSWILKVDFKEGWVRGPATLPVFTWGKSHEYCAGIFKQSMGARNRVGIEFSYRPARIHTYAGGFESLESIPGLLKSLFKNLGSDLKCRVEKTIPPSPRIWTRITRALLVSKIDDIPL
jgi:hypothetical protein